MNRKKLLMFGIPVLAVALISAAILIYYASITQTVNVQQAVTIDGEGCSGNSCIQDVGIVFSPDVIVGGAYNLTNHDNLNSRTANFVTSYSPTISGSEITTTYYIPLTTKIIQTANRLINLYFSDYHINNYNH